MQHASASGFSAGMTPEKGGAVAGANSDNYLPPNRAGSEQDARKACSEMNRLPQNPVRAQENAVPRNVHGCGWRIAENPQVTGNEVVTTRELLRRRPDRPGRQCDSWIQLAI